MSKKSNHCLKTLSNGGVEGNSDLYLEAANIDKI